MPHKNAKRRVNSYWERRHKTTKRLPSRQEELTAIAQHIATRGLTACAPTHDPDASNVLQDTNFNPMPGWR